MFLKPGPDWAGHSHSIDVKAFGTDCRILFRAGNRQAEEFRKNATDWMCSFEARYSRFRPDSIISRINEAAGIEAVRIDEELVRILALCDMFHWSTKGLFDPSTLPLIRLWDFRSKEPRVPSDIEVKRARDLVGWTRIKRDGNSIMLPEPGMGIDLGGFGKEYAIDRVMQMAIGCGIEDILVDFGCDLRVQGTPPQGGLWRIGIEDPGKPDRCEFGIGISGKAVATGATSLQTGKGSDI
jgi:thiamine biosynthesis lipoprotein